MSRLDLEDFVRYVDVLKRAQLTYNELQDLLKFEENDIGALLTEQGNVAFHYLNPRTAALEDAWQDDVFNCNVFCDDAMDYFYYVFWKMITYNNVIPVYKFYQEYTKE